MEHIKGEIQIAKRKGILERTRSQEISKRTEQEEVLERGGHKASTSGMRGREPSGQRSRVSEHPGIFAP